MLDSVMDIFHLKGDYDLAHHAEEPDALRHHDEER
jgi:hypothetical protein